MFRPAIEFLLWPKASLLCSKTSVLTVDGVLWLVVWWAMNRKECGCWVLFPRDQQCCVNVTFWNVGLKSLRTSGARSQNSSRHILPKCRCFKVIHSSVPPGFCDCIILCKINHATHIIQELAILTNHHNFTAEKGPIKGFAISTTVTVENSPIKQQKSQLKSVQESAWHV